MDLGQGVYSLCRERKHALLENLLQTNPELDADAWRSPEFGTWTALMLMSYCGYTEMCDLLIRHKADVNIVAGSDGSTALSLALSTSRHPDTVNALLDAGADVTAISHQTLCRADNAKVAFMQLSCGLSTPSTERQGDITIYASGQDICAGFKATHDYIDEFHRTLKHTLYSLAPVDTRVGLGQAGIYHEPLERVLEYMGLSMNKDQVVNISADGETKRRALIPGNQRSAKLWHDKHTAERKDN
jgi:ankyrin repeat protein